jgi:hypothetical protein
MRPVCRAPSFAAEALFLQWDPFNTSYGEGRRQKHNRRYFPEVVRFFFLLGTDPGLDPGD